MDDNIEVIIFDLGNVLIDFDHRLAAEKISQFTEKSPEEIFDLFFDSKITGLFEEGKITPYDFFLKVKEKINLKLNYEDFIPIWNQIFFLSDKNKSVYNLAQLLKDRYRLAVLSNINILHFEYLKEQFSIFNIFPDIITSYALGLRKPHPDIYRKTLDLLKVSAGDVFYTDDRPSLVQAARALGIHGFVFNSIEQLKKDFIDTGISFS